MFNSLTEKFDGISGILWPWFLATLVSSVAGSLIQSNINLIEINDLGASLGTGDWLQTVGHDLLTFAPFFALLVGTAFIFAFPVAARLSRSLPIPEAILMPLAGVVGIMLANFLANWFAPVSTIIAATRTLSGYLAIVSTGALGGLVYFKMAPSKDYADKPSHGFALLTATALVLGISFGLHLITRPQRGEAIQDQELDYRVAVVAAGLQHPWALTFLPDGRKLVTERSGTVRIIDESGALLMEPLRGAPEPFFGTEAGTMDLTLSPDFAEDSTLYISYSCGEAKAHTTCVSRGRLQGNALTEVETIFEAQPTRNTQIQFGSRLHFLPDGTLLITVGDGFDYREQAQLLDNHIGKLVRINPDGSAPEDNPFIGDPDKLDNIYSFGHRNPQGVWLDRETGVLYESEHGPYGGDEINIIEAGENYGWPLATSGINYPGDYVSPQESEFDARQPLQSWTPSIAPSGIMVYRGEDFPALYGDLLVSGLAGKGVFRLRVREGEVTEHQRLFHDLDRRIRQSVLGPDGRLYLVTDDPEAGEILRIDPPRSSDDITARQNESETARAEVAQTD